MRRTRTLPPPHSGKLTGTSMTGSVRSDREAVITGQLGYHSGWRCECQVALSEGNAKGVADLHPSDIGIQPGGYGRG